MTHINFGQRQVAIHQQQMVDLIKQHQAHNRVVKMVDKTDNKHKVCGEIEWEQHTNHKMRIGGDRYYIVDVFNMFKRDQLAINIVY